MTLDVGFDEVLGYPVEVVWRAVTDRALLTRWLMDNDFDARVGHRFRLTDRLVPDWRGWVECEVLELDPPRRMVWSWHSGRPDEVETRVIFALYPEASGTRLVLRHVGETTPGQRDAVTAGWARKLTALRHVVGPDYARCVHVGAGPRAVFDAIATIDGLKGWWTTVVSGTPAAGGELRFGFDGLEEFIVMHVDRVAPPTALRWTCLVHTSQTAWKGTTVAFDLVDCPGDGCELTLQHRGIAAASVEAGWDRFLTSLVGAVERGEGAPFGA